MDIQIELAIAEIIRKECERYKLIELGLLSSVEVGVKSLMPLSVLVKPDVFSDINKFTKWRKDLLVIFYNQIAYNRFLSQHKQESRFTRFLFFLQKKIVASIRNQYTEATIDADLAIPSRTLAFKLSVCLGEEEINAVLPMLDTLIMPSEVENSCRAFLEARYPLQFEDVGRQLDKDDAEFWHEVYLLIEKIATHVTFRFNTSISYVREIKQDVWGDVSVWLHDKWISGTIPFFESAVHLRNYIVRVCINKYYEAERRNRSSMVCMASVDPEIERLITEASCKEYFSEADPDLSEVDTLNNSEVSRALTSILWSRREPWYTKLIVGQEDKVSTLLLHYVEGKSYDEIADILDPCLSGNLRVKLCGKLRQDTVRIRRVLKERFIKLLSEQNSK